MTLLSRLPNRTEPALAGDASVQRLRLVDYLDLWPMSHLVLGNGPTREVIRDRKLLRRLLQELNRPTVFRPAGALSDPSQEGTLNTRELFSQSRLAQGDLV